MHPCPVLCLLPQLHHQTVQTAVLQVSSTLNILQSDGADYEGLPHADPLQQPAVATTTAPSGDFDILGSGGLSKLSPQAAGQGPTSATSLPFEDQPLRDEPLVDEEPAAQPAPTSADVPLPGVC